MNLKLVALAPLGLGCLLSACAAPRSVRDLASATSPFVVATHGSVPGVERAFAVQTTRTAEELALYDTRRQTAARDTASTELLWSLRQTAPDKRSVSLMERIRRDDASLRSPPAPIAPLSLRSRSDVDIGQITKMTELLKTVATSRGVDLMAAAQFGQETWKQMKALEQDANKAAEVTVASKEAK